MKVCIIGLGLIGGSMALRMRELDTATLLVGVEDNVEHAQTALELGFVDQTLPLPEAVKDARLIILAIPVCGIAQVLPRVLNLINSKQTVVDVGSTKSDIIWSVEDHPLRGRFVASHPMWGTEYSGPAAAVTDSFANKAVVICDKDQSDPDAVETATALYESLGMQIVFMSSAEHDLHVAYVSHISHITSFALANTVLEKEKEDDKIFALASGGFESTVRLAKSNPDTWASIFMQNRENVLDVLNEHITQLKKFKACLEKENLDYLMSLMKNANNIKRILR